MVRRFIPVLALCGAVTAAAHRATVPKTAPVDVLVSVRNDSIVAPDTVRPGWTRVRVEEDGAGHIVVIFRLPAAASRADVAAFVAALDTAPTTPKPGVAMGGPEIGNVGDVVVRFTPGRYLLGCVTRGSNKHRHAAAGEAKIIVVPKRPADSAHAQPPRATQEIRMVDFAYVGAEKWAAGAHMLRVENTGTQDHQLRLARLRAGSSIKDWMAAPNPGRHAVPVAGIARMGPGEVAYLPVELSPGTYVAHCLVTDRTTGRAHVELGMLRSILVE